MDRIFIMNVHRAITTQLEQLSKANTPKDVSKWVEQLHSSMQVIRSKYPKFAVAEVSEVLNVIKALQMADAQRDDVAHRAITLLKVLENNIDYEEWAAPKCIRLKSLEEAMMNADNNEALREAVASIIKALTEVKEEYAEFSPGIREDVLGVARGVLSADATRTDLKDILDRFIQEFDDLMPEKKFWKQIFTRLTNSKGHLLGAEFNTQLCNSAIEDILKEIQSEKPDFAEELIQTALNTVKALKTADVTRKQVGQIISELLQVIERHINQEYVGTCQSGMAFCNGSNRRVGTCKNKA